MLPSLSFRVSPGHVHLCPCRPGFGSRRPDVSVAPCPLLHSTCPVCHCVCDLRHIKTNTPVMWLSTEVRRGTRATVSPSMTHAQEAKRSMRRCHTLACVQCRPCAHVHVHVPLRGAPTNLHRPVPHNIHKTVLGTSSCNQAPPQDCTRRPGVPAVAAFHALLGQAHPPHMPAQHSRGSARSPVSAGATGPRAS